ncbi:hypothetical protein M0R45_021123 [Rubus argutus]|uniref:Uncharacterized protein n=1 Tax=Rubus argutus TaxID=59490 RepID=A0AAW1XC97_RUBAR
MDPPIKIAKYLSTSFYSSFSYASILRKPCANQRVHIALLFPPQLQTVTPHLRHLQILNHGFGKSFLHLFNNLWPPSASKLHPSLQFSLTIILVIVFSLVLSLVPPKQSHEAASLRIHFKLSPASSPSPAAVDSIC